MEKDIDDLLDEVESKYVKKPSKTPPSSSSTPSSRPVATKSKSHIDETIDDLLDLDVNDACSNSSGSSKLKNPSGTNVPPGNDLPKRSCLPPYLGGSAVGMGRGASVSKLACDQLRCTACDFRVCFFDNLSWSKDTDYLFLRNNAPDFQRLRSKLNRKKGARAYCCQCSWRNVQELTELKDPALKWVCGRHGS